MSCGDPVGIFHRAQQLKTNGPAALAAERKAVSFKQSSFMHEAMRVVGHSVNAAFRDKLSRPMLLSQTGVSFPRFCSEREPDILKSSKFTGKGNGLKSRPHFPEGQG